MWKKSLVLASFMAVFWIGTAHADSIAFAKSTAMLRSGPSTREAVVTRLAANTEVAIDHCSNGWCFVHVGRNEGYVAESLLAFDGHRRTVVERTYIEPDDIGPVYGYDPYYYPGPFIYGPGIYVGGYHHGWHGDFHGGGPGHWRR